MNQRIHARSRGVDGPVEADATDEGAKTGIAETNGIQGSLDVLGGSVPGADVGCSDGRPMRWCRYDSEVDATRLGGRPQME